MPIDWSRFQQDIDQALTDSAARTDERLAGQLSSLTRMTDAEIQQLFPAPKDLKAVATLMSIVKSNQTQNDKANALADHVDELATVIVTLLDKYL